MPLGKLPARFDSVVTPLMLSIMMTCVVSAISVLRTQGFDLEALSMWPSAWGLSWCVAFPVLLLVLPMVRRITGLIVHSR